MTDDKQPLQCPLRKFGPRSIDAFEVMCSACDKRLQPGDYTTLIPLGPGDDVEARERARAGRPYNAVAIEIHWACATGEEVK